MTSSSQSVALTPMRSIFLSSATKRLSLSAALAVICFLALAAIALTKQFGWWSDEVTAYRDWVSSGNAARCKGLLSNAAPFMTPSSCLRPSDPWPFLFADGAEAKEITTFKICDEAYLRQQQEDVSKFLDSGCPINWYHRISEKKGTLTLNAPNDPGSLIAYAWGRSNPAPLELLAAFVAVTVVLFLLTFVIRDFILETHIGWRRLSIVASVVAAIAVPAVHFDDMRDPLAVVALSIAAFIGTIVIIIYGRKVFFWVYSGFSSEISSGVATRQAPTLPEVGSRNAVSESPTSPTLKAATVAATFWHRVWARCIDLSLIWLAFSVVGLFLPSVGAYVSGAIGVIADVLLQMILFCIAIVAYDTLWISKVGTTPGKASFGLSVRNVDGRLPTRDEAFNRSRVHLSAGLYYTLFFPYLQILGAIFVWRNRNSSTLWDLAGRTFVQQKPIGGFRYFIAAMIAFVSISSVVVLQKAAKEIVKTEIRQSIFR